MLLSRKHRVNAALSGNPSAKHKSFIKRARIHSFVSAYYRGRKRGVVLHREVQIKAVFFTVVFYPLLVKPMHRMLGIAVEPEF